MTSDTISLLTVTQLKQYAYCPRILYYETCLPAIRPRTYKMDAGVNAHERERERAARRGFYAYEVTDGERLFDVRVESTTLGLRGLIDEVVLTPAEAIVVDYKLAGDVGPNHRMQLAAYALLVEERFQRPVNRGYIFLLKDRRFEECLITPRLRNSVKAALKQIEAIRQYEHMPPPTEQRNKCTWCEFRRFCNDV